MVIYAYMCNSAPHFKHPEGKILYWWWKDSENQRELTNFLQGSGMNHTTPLTYCCTTAIHCHTTAKDCHTTATPLPCSPTPLPCTTAMHHHTTVMHHSCALPHHYHAPPHSAMDCHATAMYYHTTAMHCCTTAIHCHTTATHCCTTTILPHHCCITAMHCCTTAMHHRTTAMSSFLFFFVVVFFCYGPPPPCLKPCWLLHSMVSELQLRLTLLCLVSASFCSSPVPADGTRARSCGGQGGWWQQQQLHLCLHLDHCHRNHHQHSTDGCACMLSCTDWLTGSHICHTQCWDI